MGYRSGRELKGKADARAVAIYARAYGQDPGFYEFWKSMETLQTALDRDATLILSTDSDLLRSLKDSKGR